MFNNERDKMINTAATQKNIKDIVKAIGTITNTMSKVILHNKKEIEYYIKNGELLERTVVTIRKDIPASKQGYKYKPIKFRMHNGVMTEYSLGHYEILNDYNIKILELPRRIWNKSYLNGDIIRCSSCKTLPETSKKLCLICARKLESKGVINKKYVQDVKEYSSSNDVDIRITLNDNINNVIILYLNKSTNSSIKNRRNI